MDHVLASIIPCRSCCFRRLLRPKQNKKRRQRLEAMPGTMPCRRPRCLLRLDKEFLIFGSLFRFIFGHLSGFSLVSSLVLFLVLAFFVAVVSLPLHSSSNQGSFSGKKSLQIFFTGVSSTSRQNPCLALAIGAFQGCMSYTSLGLMWHLTLRKKCHACQ